MRAEREVVSAAWAACGTNLHIIDLHKIDEGLVRAHLPREKRSMEACCWVTEKWRRYHP